MSGIQSVLKVHMSEVGKMRKHEDFSDSDKDQIVMSRWLVQNICVHKSYGEEIAQGCTMGRKQSNKDCVLLDNDQLEKLNPGIQVNATSTHMLLDPKYIPYPWLQLSLSAESCTLPQCKNCSVMIDKEFKALHSCGMCWKNKSMEAPLAT